MKSRPYYARLSALAFLLLVVSKYFPAQPWHALLQSAGVGLLIWALALMYLRKTGRSTWNGPSWGKTLQASPRARRFLPIVPALCAAWIPLFLLFNNRWQLSDGQLGIACGVPLGISFALLVLIKSKRNCCCDSGAAATHQGNPR